jgi:hypothetical protein
MFELNQLIGIHWARNKGIIERYESRNSRLNEINCELICSIQYVD